MKGSYLLALVFFLPRGFVGIAHELFANRRNPTFFGRKRAFGLRGIRTPSLSQSGNLKIHFGLYRLTPKTSCLILVPPWPLLLTPLGETSPNILQIGEDSCHASALPLSYEPLSEPQDLLRSISAYAEDLASHCGSLKPSLSFRTFNFFLSVKEKSLGQERFELSTFS